MVLCIMPLILLMLIWPVASFASRIEPFILGFPFGFFWVILAILLSFFTLLIVYRMDYSSEKGSKHE